MFLSDFTATMPPMGKDAGTDGPNDNGKNLGAPPAEKDENKKSANIGLGVGLGLGLPLLLGAVVFFKVRNDRIKKYQVIREATEFKSSEYIPLEDSTDASLLRDLHN